MEPFIMSLWCPRFLRPAGREFLRPNRHGGRSGRRPGDAVFWDLPIHQYQPVHRNTDMSQWVSTRVGCGSIPSRTKNRRRQLGPVKVKLLDDAVRGW